MNMVEPKVFLVGYTDIDEPGLVNYLKHTNQTEFLEFYQEAVSSGIQPGMVLCSFYAKLCYKSLVLGENLNVNKIRDIESNIESCFDTGHGSIFEHCGLNFVCTNVSRVFTHELVRHRVGTAFSQTSGRYVAIDELDMVIDPILNPVNERMRRIGEYLEKELQEMREELFDYYEVGNNFNKKKKITSAIRRWAPNGQANEIGVTLNVRALRHTIELRTNRHAEWEIRYVFAQIADIILDKWPHILLNHEVEEVDGLPEYTNIKV
jgi:thymidylate synthase (FAD)